MAGDLLRPGVYLYSLMRKVLSWLLRCDSTFLDFVFFEGKGPYPGHWGFSSGRIIILKLSCYLMESRIRQ